MKQKEVNLENSYLYKVLDRTSNPLFENNRKGSYVITPQHGVNVFVYHVYKIREQKEHLLTMSILPGKIKFDCNKTTKKEFEAIKRFALSEYGHLKFEYNEI